MISGEGIVIINSPAKVIFEFILDLHKYMLADQKIRKVYEMQPEGDRIKVKTGGMFRGIATPPAIQYVTPTAYSRIDVVSKPQTLAHIIMPFTGLFTFEELGNNQTRVLHRETFHPPLPFRWLIEPLLSDWLAQDVPAEMALLKKLIEEGIPEQ